MVVIINFYNCYYILNYLFNFEKFIRVFGKAGLDIVLVWAILFLCVESGFAVILLKTLEYISESAAHKKVDCYIVSQY